MPISFEYDLGEIVGIGGRELSLRRAVVEYIDARKSVTPANSEGSRWLRRQGRKPHAFETTHMEELARLPIFAAMTERKVK